MLCVRKSVQEHNIMFAMFGAGGVCSDSDVYNGDVYTTLTAARPRAHIPLDQSHKLIWQARGVDGVADCVQLVARFSHRLSSGRITRWLCGF